ncbi:MAG TPA: hypothetical protein DCZ69_12230 [Syntrophobacteraceae bacterium]|nr:hypothetical protein [Syntrophobacteraceae bacterium]
MIRVKRNSIAAAKRRRPYLLLGLLLCLVAVGCGQKGFPRITQQAPPPQIKDAHAEVQPRGVEITWTMPDEVAAKTKGRFYQFVLQKAEVTWDKRNCLDCPASFQDKQVIDPLRPEPAYKRGRRFSWIDSNIQKERAYRYQIAIRDDQGRILSVSNGVAVKVLPVPGAPAKVTATTDKQGIMVRWQKPGKEKEQAGAANQAQLKYLLERSPSGKEAKWESISPVPIEGLEFLDSTVASDQNYDYRVTAVLIFEDSNIRGEPSTVNRAQAPDTLTPPPPQSVWVVPSKGHLEVHWLESEGKVQGYHVYRRQGKEITRLTAKPLDRPPFVDQAAQKNETYFYAVSAVSPGPDSREGLLSKWSEIRNVFF